MAVEIPVPEAAYPEVEITLAGITYTLLFKESLLEKGRLFFDLFIGEVLVKPSVKVMEDQGLLSRYVLDDFSHGEIFCFRVGTSLDKAVKDNTGIGKNYGLFYVSNQEELA
jgi:hypothetical protein